MNQRLARRVQLNLDTHIFLHQGTPRTSRRNPLNPRLLHRYPQHPPITCPPHPHTMALTGLTTPLTWAPPHNRAVVHQPPGSHPTVSCLDHPKGVANFGPRATTLRVNVEILGSTMVRQCNKFVIYV